MFGKQRFLHAVLVGAVTVYLGASSASAQTCAADCNDDQNVSIGELITAVNIALGNQPLENCPAADPGGDGGVSIGELIQAVNIALAGGCDAPPPPTATPTPEVFSAVCDLGEGSRLDLSTAAIPINLVPTAQINFECSEGAASTSGLAGDVACSCSVDNFDPLQIPGLGDVCVEPFAGCPSRPGSCDAGASVDVFTTADRNVGTCTGNDDCANQCDTYCGGLGATPISTTCEDFCLGGENDGDMCLTDAECPGGSCGGPDVGAEGTICSCVCTQPGTGDPGPAGSLACSLGVSITVELPPTGECGDTPPSITLSPLCGDLTTGNGTGIMLNAVNMPEITIPRDGPSELTGSPASCTDLASGSLSGATFIGHLGFFGSAVGDIVTENVFVCQ